MTRTGQAYILIQKLFWVVLMPILGYLGFVQLVPISSRGVFWLILLFGAFLVLQASVPIKFEYDPSTAMFYNRITRRWISREKVEVSRELTRDIGLGFMFYSLGGLVSDAWSAWELIVAFASLPVFVKGYFDLIRDILSRGRVFLPAKEFDSLRDAPEYYNQAIDEKQAENYDKAIELFLRAAQAVQEIEPSSKRLADIYYQIGNCHFVRWDHSYSQSIVYFTKALQINPRDIDALYQRGVSYGKLGSTEEALSDFERVLSIKPRHEPAKIAIRVAQRNQKLRDELHSSRADT